MGSTKRGAHARRESHRGPVVVCFGEMMINFVPTITGVSLADAPAYKKSPAGATANVAVAISRLGGSAAFIGKVGKDEFGYMLSDILKQNGVDNSGLLFEPHARTALAFYSFKGDGEPQFMFYRNPSADMFLHPEEIDVNLIKKATIFHYGSNSLIKEPCRSAHLAAMNVANMSGSILSYAPNLTLPLWPSTEAAKEGIMSIWNYADIIKVSVEEIRILIEGDDPYDDKVIMKKLYHYNLKLLLVTEGARGCRYYTKDFNGRVSGFEVEAVDTTGAGDSFVGGLLSIVAAHKHIYQDEKRLREALDFANACGAVTATGRGAIPSLPTKDAVLRILLMFSNS
ncbi:probable fructokinase-7 [Gastrolobium bilobum]|uniref:probable fructokinase-7 n=1 Tax=Gastrolobium bilobum TaxID=150636 RepID=UPI002AAFF43B|nr:probable fructokinase-7 [Gastrolobium bilobum]